MLIAFNKPFGIVTQFTSTLPGRGTLAQFGLPPKVYPLGRLDAETEGLLLLTDEGRLNYELLQPRRAHRRRYWAQVERVPSAADLTRLGQGIIIQSRKTLPCRAWILEPQPEIPPRDPPIRFRKTVPSCWIALELVEGKNHQVRRMTAAVGFPTLRLIRVQIGDLLLGDLPSGRWKVLSPEERRRVLA